MKKAINTAIELSLQFKDADNVLESLMILAKHDEAECYRWATTRLGDNGCTQTLLNWVAHRTRTNCDVAPTALNVDQDMRHTR